VAGNRHDLPAPFHVLATQNPLEQEGTYPLPEAQLDRFLLQIDVGYPDEAAERQIMIGTTGATTAKATQALTPADLIAAQALVRRLPIGESVVEAILKLVRAGRPDSSDLDVVRQRRDANQRGEQRGAFQPPVTVARCAFVPSFMWCARPSFSLVKSTSNLRVSSLPSQAKPRMNCSLSAPPLSQLASSDEVM